MRSFGTAPLERNAGVARPIGLRFEISGLQMNDLRRDRAGKEYREGENAEGDQILFNL